MKSYRQQKRKITEITRKQDELMGVSVKKSATGPAWGHPKTTESITKPHLEPRIQLQVPSAKIKLQLFPINEQTRLGLEKDGYNPFLELTLSARKRISSVARHLNTKWGSSSVAIGQLVLFPYNIKLEQVASCRRWTSNDNAITAWEVYVDVGRPSFFRLRYAWYSNLQHEIFHIPPKASLLEAHTDSEGRRRGCSTVLEISSYQKGKLDVSCETIQQLTNVNEALTSDVNELKPLDGSYDLPMNNETVLTKNSSCQEMKLNPLRCTRGAFDENSSLWPVKHQEGCYLHIMQMELVETILECLCEVAVFYATENERLKIILGEVSS
ncbi:UNVERIFIED_CONTAM: TSL-kinase interacting protein 1 [Sesamum indicum]